MKLIFFIVLLFPLLCFSQEFNFQLQPEAFPLEIEGWEPFCPWSGGINATTPEFCDIDADGDLDYFSGSYQNYYWFFENTGMQSVPEFQYVSSTFDSIYPVSPGSAYWSDIDFCDIDSDGDFDAMLCNGCIGLAINQGTSLEYCFSSPFDTLRDQSGEFLWASNMAAADIDGDGDYDLFGGTCYSGEIKFFENVGTSLIYEYILVNETWQNIQVTEGVVDPCFHDLDGERGIRTLGALTHSHAFQA